MRDLFVVIRVWGNQTSVIADLWQPQPLIRPYAIIKDAMDAFTRALASELLQGVGMRRAKKDEARRRS